MYDETIGKLAKWAKEFGAVKAAAFLLAAFIGKGLILAIFGLIAPLTALAALLIANPFVLLVAALAGGAYLIYDNWGGIVKFFKDTWQSVKAAVGFAAWIDDVKGWGFNFYIAMTDWWSGIATFFRLELDAVKAAVGFAAWIDDVRGWGLDFYVAMTDWWSGIATFFRLEWERVKAAVDFEWLNKVSSLIGGFFGGEGRPRRKAGGGGGSPSTGAFVPAFLGDSPAARGGNANIIVDFLNMPRGTRTETRADSDTDLEVNTGYAMQGAQ